ncbi:MAG: acetyl-CoA carboxylase biotin carboxylase subunit [Firmicutes bacterium]|jgi:acetyl-CoA carboxylase biotin carboxylase subunit|nr:acetyl-CoA carboxylase biotin carboxylase subunit [Bacillota bacterium]HQD40885.1 acetyl-CoA carboxylase biotin carboxylase subunit [Bacillota bacterium]
MGSFKKVLIANRGEIAVRVIRACKELNIASVAIYSEADRDAYHTRLADEAICVGPGPSNASYLNIPNIISAAMITGADAIHPGYGFLAENANFAEICTSHGIKFIGPSPGAIERLGDKATARKIMEEAGVPVVPGSSGPITCVEEALEVAHAIGYPVLVKASSGGGGRGMRLAHHPDDLVKAIRTAQSEAEAAFGNAEVYLEKFIEEPRHIEFQLLCDEHGQGVYVGERDCSIQRRHQKMLEEAPSPAVSEALRREMGLIAVRGALAAGYTNAGTMEFLLDRFGNYYFIEMNARIQVEHPVTELITGIDLVKEQIRIAQGEELGYLQEDIKIRGHAIECRITAEDPERDFLPQPGQITYFQPPMGPGIRVETALYPGYVIPPYYDSMVAKVIAWGADRTEAIARMKRALAEFQLEGVKNTIPFHQKVLDNAFFRKGEVYTNFIQRRVLAEE